MEKKIFLRTLTGMFKIDTKQEGTHHQKEYRKVKKELEDLEKNPINVDKLRERFSAKALNYPTS